MDELDRKKGGISDGLRVLLYRVTGEALTNVAKHTEAPGAPVQGLVIEDCIQISVGDDGTGFLVED